MTTTPWATYVRMLREERGLSGAAVGRESSGAVTQSKISNWEAGKFVPDRAADVAAFATFFGRNVLEAFVVAGMLTLEEASAGLSGESTALIARLLGTPRRLGRRPARTRRQ